MSSILAQYKAKNANFTASSSKTLPDTGPYRAFETSRPSFFTETAPYYWQVSFPQYVVASSYQIGGESSWTTYTTKWEVSYSNDGTNFVPVQTDSRSSPTTYTYNIDPPISCKHFRLTAKEVSQDSMALTFIKFDLFGLASSPKEGGRYTCNIRRIKAQLITNVLIMTMQSRVTY